MDILVKSIQSEQNKSIQSEQATDVSIQSEQATDVSIQSEQATDVSIQSEHHFVQFKVNYFTLLMNTLIRSIHS